MTVREARKASQRVPRTRVGNDVVDLGRGIPARKPQHPALARRILAPREARHLHRAGPDPALLWAYWAGKEAAFKAICKRRGQAPVFRHSSFQVSWGVDPGEEADPTGTARSEVGRSDGSMGSCDVVTPWRQGHVTYEDERLRLLISHDDDALHAVAWFDPGLDAPHRGGPDSDPPPAHPPLLQWALHRLDAVPATRQAASARIRPLVIDAASRLLSVDPRTLAVAQAPGAPGHRPPLLLHHGEPCGVDVSLSHHGRFLAWALLVPRGGPSLDASSSRPRP